MRLDIPTITTIASIVYATQTIAVFVQYRINKTYEGLGAWLLGAVLQAVGFLLMPAVNIPSIWMLSILANPSVFIGQVMLYVGIAKFLERQERTWVPVSLAAAFVLSYSYFIVVDPSIQARSVVIALATALISFKIALSILRGKAPQFSLSAAFTASVFLAYGGFEIAMAVVSLVLPPLASYADIYKTPIRMISFVVPIVVSMLWTFGFILMVNQRLNAENLEEREKMRMIFDISPDAVLITRLRDGLIVEVNAGLLAITGFAREEILGRGITDVGVWDDLGERERYYAELEGPGLVENREFSFRRKDGSRFLGMVSGRRIHIHDETHVISVVYDFTERKLAEQRIRDLLAEKELILKDVHHRIKNNMSTMRSLLSLQAGTLGDPSSVSALEDAANRIQSMMVLYDKLYKSAAYDELSVAEYLPPLIDEIISNFPNAGVVRVEKRLEDFVLGVGQLQPLGLIVNELLTNIMKYAFAGRAGGTIAVSASLKGDLVSLAIADDGNGMPESINFDNSPGFGLLLVKALTLQLKGRIGIERGSGTRILLEFAR
jgi:PAS domain S-box-containing protein